MSANSECPSEALLRPCEEALLLLFEETFLVGDRVPEQPCSTDETPHGPWFHLPCTGIRLVHDHGAEQDRVLELAILDQLQRCSPIA